MRHNALHQLSRAFLLLGLAALAGILWVLAPLLAPLFGLGGDPGLVIAACLPVSTPPTRPPPGWP
ncbi:MAG: hypothetical protein NTV69_05590, partial [Caldilinea sp.]|nr:hypothetical protein [Caldilinea sp.]